MNIVLDMSHVCHENMHSQTGRFIGMEHGLIHSRSFKQTINSKSSTKSELIGRSDFLPYVLWYIYFLKEQRYEIDTKILLQGNESTIKLLANGKQSSGSLMKHIDIQYFFNNR